MIANHILRIMAKVFVGVRERRRIIVDNIIEYKELNPDFIINRFPELKNQVLEEIEGFDEFLPHVVFGNIFNPLTVKLLKQYDYKLNNQLRRIFDMYDYFATYGDDDTVNLLEVTLLEYLWDEKITYERSQQMMGEKTKEIMLGIQWLNVPTE